MITHFFFAQFPFIDGGGFDHCYDCRAEIDILVRYIRSCQTPDTGDMTTEESRAVVMMSREISNQLSRGRTLASPNIDPEERKRGIQQRQYINGVPAYLHDGKHVV